MKKYCKDFWKIFLWYIIILLIWWVWFIVFANISWPSESVDWEPNWGLFQTYFNNMIWSCDEWEIIIWFGDDFQKKCE